MWGTNDPRAVIEYSHDGVTRLKSMCSPPYQRPRVFIVNIFFFNWKHSKSKRFKPGYFDGETNDSDYRDQLNITYILFNVSMNKRKK